MAVHFCSQRHGYFAFVLIRWNGGGVAPGCVWDEAGRNCCSSHVSVPVSLGELVPSDLCRSDGK